MKYDMMGIIFNENPEAAMGELTEKRSLAAVPFGGRYRIIDFILSNMVNSAIVKVGMITAYNYQSLSDHLGNGKDWDLDRKTNGLYILPPREMKKEREVRAGIDMINNVLYFLEKSRQEYVLVADCNTICNIDFRKVLKAHSEKEADITLIYKEIGEIEPKSLSTKILLDMSDDGRVTDIQVYPLKQKSNAAYMHMFLIRREVLIEMIGDAVAHNKHYISKDLFLPNIDTLKIYGYKFDGYARQIDNAKSFYDANLELLKKEVRDELFGLNADMPIYTKVKDTVPTRYLNGSEVGNSFIADGCIIEGTVKNSILFRGVHVAKSARVENCIIMQDSKVMENCVLENVIFDKEVVLRSGKKLIGQDTYPMVIGKKTVI